MVFFVSSLAHIERLMSVNVCILMTVYLTKLVQIFNIEEEASLYEKRNIQPHQNKIPSGNVGANHQMLACYHTTFK